MPPRALPHCRYHSSFPDENKDRKERDDYFRYLYYCYCLVLGNNSMYTFNICAIVIVFGNKGGFTIRCSSQRGVLAWHCTMPMLA